MGFCSHRKKKNYICLELSKKEKDELQMEEIYKSLHLLFSFWFTTIPGCFHAIQTVLKANEF